MLMFKILQNTYEMDTADMEQTKNQEHEGQETKSYKCVYIYIYTHMFSFAL